LLFFFQIHFEFIETGLLVDQLITFNGLLLFIVIKKLLLVLLIRSEILFIDCTVNHDRLVLLLPLIDKTIFSLDT